MMIHRQHAPHLLSSRDLDGWEGQGDRRQHAVPVAGSRARPGPRRNRPPFPRVLPPGQTVAVDTARIVADLLAFHDFTDRLVIAVGAGGGQLAEYGRVARQVLAVDCDAAALTPLAARVRQLGLEDRFALRHADLLAVGDCADVVLFEFSLHEMPDAGAALDHALRLAPAVVILDHSPGSPWAYHVVEEDKVAAAWRAVGRRLPARVRHYRLDHRFRSHQELVDKVRTQGDEAIRRAERFSHETDISIPVRYGLALLG